MTYKAPVRDLLFALTGRRRTSAGSTSAFPAADAETVAAVLEAAGAFAAEVLAPLNRPGDTAGARYENGRVRAPRRASPTPTAVRRGRLERPGGRPGVRRPGPAQGAGDRGVRDGPGRQHGLRPLPDADPGRDRGASRRTATTRQKALYLPKLVSGEWTGTMNLTEPQAGSDLGALDHPRRARRRGRLSAHRPEDLHHLGRPRHGRQHRPPGARPPARRAARLARHLAVPGPEAAGGRGRRRWARPTPLRCGSHRAQARHPRLAHLRDALRGRPGRAGRRAQPAAWRRCS